MELQIESMAAAAFYFTLYAFAGWLLENGYNWRMSGVFMKEGLFRGPFKPMYGFAPVILLLMIGSGTHWGISLLLCLLVPSVVEYVSGFLLLRFFHRRWWDYSKHRYQLHGHICLSFSLIWMVLSLLVVYFLHAGVAAIYRTVSPVWHWGWPVFAVYFAAELAWVLWSSGLAKSARATPR